MFSKIYISFHHGLVTILIQQCSRLRDHHDCQKIEKLNRFNYDLSINELKSLSVRLY